MTDQLSSVLRALRAEARRVERARICEQLETCGRRSPSTTTPSANSPTPRRRPMSELYPTKTRLALLRAVEAGDVWAGTRDDSTQIDMFWVDPQPPHDSVKVTARIDEFHRAGWLSDEDLKPSLSDAGRAVLEEAPA